MGKAKVSQVDWCLGSRMTAPAASAARRFSAPTMRQRTPQMTRAPWIARRSHTIVNQYSGVPRMKIEATSEKIAHGITLATSHSTNSAERNDPDGWPIESAEAAEAGVALAGQAARLPLFVDQRFGEGGQVGVDTGARHLVQHLRELGRVELTGLAGAHQVRGAARRHAGLQV